MGFTAGIYRTKKYEDLTPAQYDVIDRYIHFKNDDWTKEHYHSWEEFKDNFETEDMDFDPTPEMIEFFEKNAMYKRECFGKTIYEELETWCSNATQFDDWMREKLGKEEGGYAPKKFITKDIVKDCIEYCNSELEKFKLTNVIVTHAYKRNKDGSILLIPCDGIEVKDINGRTKRTAADDFQDSDIFAAFDLCPDEWFENAFISLKECMENILLTTDFDKDVIIYESGW